MTDSPLNSENLSPDAAEIAKLDDFKSRLKHHDWYHYFSDDGRVVRAGEQAGQALVNEAKNGPISFKKAYNDEHKRQFDRPCFTGEKEPNKYPWVCPFPEAETDGGGATEQQKS